MLLFKKILIVFINVFFLTGLVYTFRGETDAFGGILLLIYLIIWIGFNLYMFALNFILSKLINKQKTSNIVFIILVLLTLFLLSLFLLVCSSKMITFFIHFLCLIGLCS